MSRNGCLYGLHSLGVQLATCSPHGWLVQNIEGNVSGRARGRRRRYSNAWTRPRTVRSLSQFPEVTSPSLLASSALKLRPFHTPWNRGALSGRRLSSFKLLLGSTIATLVVALVSGASAQEPGILVVAGPEVSKAMERSIKRALAGVGDVMDDQGYVAQARAQHLDPRKDAAVTKVGPTVGAQLIVQLSVPPVSQAELSVRFLSGADGSLLLSHTAPMRGSRLKRPARSLRQLRSAAEDALEKAAAARAASPRNVGAEPRVSKPAQQDLLEAEDEIAEQQSAPVAAEPSASEGEEVIMDDPELSARLQSSAQQEQVVDSKPMSVQLSAGLGPGLHALNVPTPGDSSDSGKLDTGLAPAIELAAMAQLSLGHWLLSAEAQYRTFFRIEPVSVPSAPAVPDMQAPAQAPAMDEMPAAATTQLSSHSLVVGVAPGYRFVESRRGVAIYVMLGWSYRSLRAPARQLPGSTLRGFVARPTLRWPFGDGVFQLRVAAELLAVQSSESNAAGFMSVQSSGGLGLGVEAGIDAKLAELLIVGLQYRHSQVSVARGAAEAATDEEWYVSVHAGVSL